MIIKIPTEKATACGTSIAKDYISQMLKASNLTLTRVNKLINQRYPEYQSTTQNLSNKISRGSLRDYEIAQIASVCGFTLQLSNNDTLALQDKPAETTLSRNPSANDKESIRLIVSEGYTTEASPNFGVIVFAGQSSGEAAEYYQGSVNADTNAIDELAIIAMAEKKYKVIAKPAAI